MVPVRAQNATAFSEATPGWLRIALLSAFVVITTPIARAAPKTILITAFDPFQSPVNRSLQVARELRAQFAGEPGFRARP